MGQDILNRWRLQPIVSATTTSHDVALPTLVDEDRHDVVAFLARLRPVSVSPVLVVTLVVVHQSSHDGLHSLLSCPSPCLVLSLLPPLPPCRLHDTGRRIVGLVHNSRFVLVGVITCIDLGCTCVQAALVPLVAMTGLPSGRAHIAELEPAPASIW